MRVQRARAKSARLGIFSRTMQGATPSAIRSPDPMSWPQTWRPVLHSILTDLVVMKDTCQCHEQGRLLPPVIAATFSLRDAAAAHAYMQTQSVPGRVVLTVGSEAAAS